MTMRPCSLARDQVRPLWFGVVVCHWVQKVVIRWLHLLQSCAAEACLPSKVSAQPKLTAVACTTTGNQQNAMKPSISLLHLYNCVATKLLQQPIWAVPCGRVGGKAPMAVRVELSKTDTFEGFSWRAHNSQPIDATGRGREAE